MEEVHVSVSSWWRWSGPQQTQIWLTGVVISVDVNRLIHVNQLHLSRPPAVKLEARVLVFVSTMKCHRQLLFLQKSPLSCVFLQVVKVVSPLLPFLVVCLHAGNEPLCKATRVWKHLNASFCMKRRRLCWRTRSSCCFDDLPALCHLLQTVQRCRFAGCWVVFILCSRGRYIHQNAVLQLNFKLKEELMLKCDEELSCFRYFLKKCIQVLHLVR